MTDDIKKTAKDVLERIHDNLAAAAPALAREVQRLAPFEAECRELRDVLAGLASYLAVGSGDDSTTAAQYDARIRQGMKMMTGPMMEAMKRLSGLSVVFGIQSTDWGSQIDAIAAKRLEMSQALSSARAECAEHKQAVIDAMSIGNDMCEQREVIISDLRQTLAARDAELDHVKLELGHTEGALAGVRQELSARDAELAEAKRESEAQHSLWNEEHERAVKLVDQIDTLRAECERLTKLCAIQNHFGTAGETGAFVPVAERDTAQAACAEIRQILERIL